MKPFIIDLPGTTLSEADINTLKHPLLGGIILFAHNIKNPQQLIELTNSIRNINPDLFICVDQEGGRVQRLKAGFTRLPAMRRFGELYDKNPDDARAKAEMCGWLMATEVMSVGIDFSFAPVLDLDLGISDVIGNRAFHKDPKITAELATIFTHGIYQAGSIAVGKHFPGHGGVAPDSHVELPIDHRDFEALKPELSTFQHLIDHELPAIMPAHITFTKVDDQLVTYSKKWLKTILREQMGFHGVIISDDLCMAAAHTAPIEQRVQNALDAGCDMVLVCHDQEAIQRALDNSPNHTARANFSPKSLQGKRAIPYDVLLENPNWQHAAETIKQLV